MKRFEYKVLKKDISGGFFSGGGIVEVDELQKELDKLGNEGWELVNTFDTNMHEGKSRDVVLILRKNFDTSSLSHFNTK